MASARSKLAAIASCLAFGLAACSDRTTSDGATTTYDNGATTPTYDYSASSAATSTTVAESTDTTPGTGTATSATVAESTDTTLGGLKGTGLSTIVTVLGGVVSDWFGNTLYTYTPDGSDAATCTGECASVWPPVLSESFPYVSVDLSPELVTLVHGEGGLQLAYNGHPLYYFTGDSGLAQTNGQGSGGVWFVLDANGNQITS